MLKIEGVFDENIEFRRRMVVAPELEHFHVFVVPPTLSCPGVRKLLGCDRNHGPVADPGQSLERTFDIVGNQFDDQVRVARGSQIPMRDYRKPADHDEANLRVVECVDDRVERGGFHFAGINSRVRTRKAVLMANRNANSM